jgi:hypothetical protein
MHKNGIMEKIRASVIMRIALTDTVRYIPQAEISMSEPKTTFDDLKAASVPWTFNSDVKVRLPFIDNLLETTLTHIQLVFTIDSYLSIWRHSQKTSVRKLRLGFYTTIRNSLSELCL